jgi:choline-sulfatase
MKSDIEHIFLIVIDCGRQDYLYTAKAETPELDRLAQEAAVFTNAFCQINATVPSHVSLFTSQYPCDHGIYSNFEKPVRGDQALPALLEKNGWETLAFTSVGFLSQLMGDWFAYNQTIACIPAFENPGRRTYGLRRLRIVKNRRSAAQTVNKVISRLKKGMKREFYWIHFYDAHIPYSPTSKILRKYYTKKENKEYSFYEEAKRLGLFIHPAILPGLSLRSPLSYFLASYRASIECIDSAIGRLTQFLKKSEIWDQSLFIVTSDHGENLVENGVFCSHAKLFDETTKVPLYWRDPAQKGEKEIDALVQHADIRPSILERLGIEVTSDSRGKSLYPAIAGSSKNGHDFVFTEHARQYQYTIRTEEWQYLWQSKKRNHPEGLELEDNFLINRKKSKQENRYENFAHQYPKICRELKNMGETLLSSPLKEVIERYPVSNNMEEILKSWGYI